MSKFILLFVLLFFIPAGIIYAQNQPLPAKKRNTRFQSYNSVGLLTGDQTVSWSIQTVNGVQWKTFFVGVGLGFDFYRIGTTPVFLDLRKTFGKGPNKVFAYGDIGYQIPWPGNGKNYFGVYTGDDLDGGLYIDIGVGYLLEFGKKNALVLSAGYSYKSLSENIVAVPICLPGVPCEPQSGKYEYKFNRLSFKVGWRF
jgi:hypothetical protein